MASNRLPSSTSKLRQFLTPRLPRPFLLPLQSILQPGGIPTPYGVSARLKGDTVQASSVTKGWSGTSTDDHAVNRTKKRDITDPEMESSEAGQQEREENAGIADATKSQATTERDHRKSGKKAKEEHPHAPDPVIGMNDERGEKGP